MTVTELNIVPGQQERDWVVNVFETDASEGIDIKPAATDHRHGIKKITITSFEDEWVEILDGGNILIGPMNLEKGVPWSEKFESAIYGTRDCAIILKTESDFKIHLIVQGTTGPPLPTPSASPSASPSA